MSHLEVPEAKLYHEVVGSGPLLLCISGGNGSGEVWAQFAQALKDHFTVVYYDRRGFSRSTITGPQNYAERLSRDADDAALLIEKYSSPSGSPATIIGNSSGGIVALQLLLRRPDLVRTLIPYEPPVARMCPDYEGIWKQQQEIYDVYRAEGPFPAFKLFGKITQSRMMDGSMIDLSMPFLWSNMQFWFEREFLQYPNVDFDAERDFTQYKDKLMPIYGEMTGRTAYQYLAMKVLCEKFGLEYLEFPGEHMGFLTHGEPFAKKLLESLKARDEFYKDL